ncbi:helix-turn-helix transcriptional regulator [Neptuniibacter halophilus]|uniref:helix-turn-helix transcriptional regulator n=1 Tax=Neptuniibacter halophilus TaxID=651666 RepID=UPI0025746E0D|nr:LuxR family transcriptional regulator [Neptuniibacter halophilus]
MNNSEWHKQLAEVVSSLGEEDFPAKMTAALRQITPFEFCVIFAYRQDDTPLCLYNDFPTEQKRRMHVEDYQAGPYLLDPFYLATVKPIEPGLYRFKEVAPDRFFQGEYYKNYYQATRLAEEIGLFVSVGDISIVTSLMRNDKPFSTPQMKKLQEVAPLFQAAVIHHWQEIHQHFPGSEAVTATANSRIQQLLQEKNYSLTPREVEVVEYTLKGYSAEAAAQVMEISTGTVRIHKRNIYSKLRINSQGELFSIFFNAFTENQ